MVEEIWKPVEGYEDSYEVSNTGKVRSKDRTIMLSGKRSGQVRKYEGKELKILRSQGYQMVHLQKPGSRETIGVGRLVAYHFLPGFKESGRYKVKYKDGNTTNCCIDNLE